VKSGETKKIGTKSKAPKQIMRNGKKVDEKRVNTK
jgi:hypothetical protein